MSEENLEIVSKIVAAWNSGGAEALLEFCPEDVVWVPFPEWPEGPEPRRGHGGVRELLGAWTDNFDEFRVVINGVREFDDRVAVRAEMTGHAKGLGIPLGQPLGWVCSDFRPGQIGEIHFFLTWDETLEAARLPE